MSIFLHWHDVSMCSDAVYVLAGRRGVVMLMKWEVQVYKGGGLLGLAFEATGEVAETG